MATNRVNVRVPREIYERLKAQADAAGYSSLNQLARCVLIQFVRHAQKMREMVDRTAWMDDMAGAHDPRNRKQINERL